MTMSKESTAAGRRSEAPVRALPDRLLGVVGAAMVAAAIFLLLFGGPGDGQEGVAAPPPTLRLESPADAAVVEPPLRILFRAEGSLSRTPGGWGTGEFHVHAELAGRELMPGPDDIRRVEGGLYEWTVANPPRGASRLRLFWSDRSHRAMPETSTAEVGIVVQ
jgi:hypothetical protein